MRANLLRGLAATFLAAGMLLSMGAQGGCDQNSSPGKASQAGHAKDGDPKSKRTPEVKIVTGDSFMSPAGRACSYQSFKKGTKKKWKGHIFTCKQNKQGLYVWVG